MKRSASHILHLLIQILLLSPSVTSVNQEFTVSAAGFSLVSKDRDDSAHNTQLGPRRINKQ